MNGVLGISADDNGDVNYGLDMAQGDVLEEGTIVQGHCYVWLVVIFCHANMTFCNQFTSKLCLDQIPNSHDHRTNIFLKVYQ